EGQYDHDAAVISFRGGIPSGFVATPIDNDKYANYGDRKVFVYGFGRLNDYSGIVGEDTYQKIGTLRRGEMIIDSIYNQFADRYYTSLSTRTQLCQGDSGGPQFLEKNGVAIQVGINSAVEGPTLPNGHRSCKGPSHVTKVAYMYDWIMKQIR
ncbi:MAG: trypsin-like serine protease, partial [Proteobacteria bacterium]